jgi:hypothetical protein
MIKRIIIGVITILAALPSLAFTIFFVSEYKPSPLHCFDKINLWGQFFDIDM